MDYTSRDLGFKLRKGLRYVRLYGPSRTWGKILGQYHMKRSYAQLPARRGGDGGHVGLIGCGNFAFSTIAYYLRKRFGPVLRASMDVNINRAASLYERYGLAYFTDQAEELLEDKAIDLVYIASNHASHADYAIEALNRGMAVHIEKPHAVNESQLRRLCATLSATEGKGALGFNRPDSRIGGIIRRHLRAQPGAAMMNWFIAGHQIDADHWYFRESEGGRILGNLCHWTDFVFQMVPGEGRFPITITPTRSEKSDCDIGVTFLFGDGTIAAITFSAKGHTFEGVRERFAAHKGEALIAMDDFKTLVIEVGARKWSHAGWYRDHGHERRICDSYRMVRGDQPGAEVAYIWETGLLFLKTKEALDRNEKITIQRYEESFSSG